MNKYIKTDIENAVVQMKAAIMNTLYDIDTGEEEEIDLGPNISWNLFYECLQEAGWKRDEMYDWNPNGCFWIKWYSPSGKYCLVSGSFWCGVNYVIKVCQKK